MNWKEQQKLQPEVINAQCEASPEEVDYNGERLEVLNRHIQSLINEGLICSGSYCLWRHGKVFADVAIGNLACEWQGNDRFLPNTLYEIQSVGKFFTAVSILKLMEDGILYLGQPVMEWIPEFAEGELKNITILHLLTHTSGLCSFGENYPADRRNWETKVDDSNPTGTWISAIVKTGLHAKPGEKWIYSIAGYYILGEIIRRASGMEAEDFIRETLFLPCGMTEIHWRKEGTEELIKRYNVANETDVAMVKESKEKGILSMARRTYSLWDGIPETAGGQMSTSREMMRFAEMLLRDGTYRGNRVIGKKALSYLGSNLLGKSVKDVTYDHNQTIYYGAGVPVYSREIDFGKMLSEHTIYHEGAGCCMFLADREEDFAAMFQTSFRKEFDWNHRAVMGTTSIIWSGIL